VTPDILIQEIEFLGGRLELHGERVLYELPVAAADLLADLRIHKEAVIKALRARSVPAIPKRVRLLAWQLKNPPIVLNRWSVVNDVRLFVDATLRELEAALAGKSWLAGNRSIRELVDRLEQVGVQIEVLSSNNASYGATPVPGGDAGE
jgi:hypothetical protein